VRVLVVGNRGDDDPGFVGERLRERGHQLVPRHRDDPDGLDAVPAGMVLVLGSEWSVYWEHVTANVEAEARLLRNAHQAGLPILGICYGAQMLAHALGGSVHPAERPEVGWCEVETTEPLVIPQGPWLQWHYDTFVVPPGAVELARSMAGPQAFVLGRALAVQFHPEADENVVARWSAEPGDEELRRLGLDPDELIARTRAERPASRLRAFRLVDWFLDQVAPR